MKITKSRLKEIIKEELQQLMPETLTGKKKKKKEDLEAKKDRSKEEDKELKSLKHQ